MKNRGKFLVLLVGLLFISTFIISFVSAADIPTPGQVATSSGGFFSNLFTGNSSFWNNLLNFSNIGFAKILIFFLVALIVYAISDFLPFMGSQWGIKGSISIVIALLATLYLNSADVYTILVSYGALGITLTGIIPFIIIAVISKREFDEGRTFTSRLLWVAFIVILTIKIATTWSSVNSIIQWIYVIIFSLSLGMLIWQRKIFMIWLKQKLKMDIDTGELSSRVNETATLAQLRQLRDALIESSVALDSPEIRNIDSRISQLEKAIKK